MKLGPSEEIRLLAKSDIENYQAGKRVDPALLPIKISPLYKRALRHSPGTYFTSIEAGAEIVNRILSLFIEIQTCGFIWLGPISGYRVNRGLDQGSSPASIPFFVSR